jgi:hypothetical protein
MVCAELTNPEFIVNVTIEPIFLILYRELYYRYADTHVRTMVLTRPQTRLFEATA